MGFFKRITDLTKASLNDLLDKAEDPVKMLSQYLRELEQDMAEAEVSVAKQISIEKKLKQQYEEADEMATKREQQAMKALEANNEDLARKALADKKIHQQKADDFKVQYENAKTNADQLRNQLQEMKDEFYRLKNKKATLEARAESAKAQKKINQTMSGFGKDNAVKGFSRMEDKVMDMEAEAEASKELKNMNTSLDDELDDLDDLGVDDELAKLKEKMNSNKDKE